MADALFRFVANPKNETHKHAEIEMCIRATKEDDSFTIMRYDDHKFRVGLVLLPFYLNHRIGIKTFVIWVVYCFKTWKTRVFNIVLV